jgi:GWxTD domain-containing protein
MKYYLIGLFLVFSLVGTAKPKVFFNYKVYYTPDQTPYVSTMLQFSSGSFKYQSLDNGALQTTVEITQIFRLNDSIVMADKYELNSPVMADSVVEDFFDVQHYGLDPGIYNYELIIKDLVSGEEVTGEQSLEINIFDNSKIQLSDIEFIQTAYQSTEENNFVKNGFFLLPYMTNYFPPEMNKIAFYLEIYNTISILGDDEKFLLTYSISDFDTGKDLEGIFQFKRLSTAPVIPVIGYLPISEVPSGDFTLLFNVINKDNDTIFSKDLFFQRRSDIKNEYVSIDNIAIDEEWMTQVPRDSIPYFLGSIMPISPKYEYETIRKMLKTDDTTSMEKYFFAFWKKTAPENTAREWQKYRHQIYYCEALFGTQVKHAYETDRGRVWLKYGAPNQFIDRPNEPSAYPYQIWQYYRIGKRSNVKFIFYSPSLVTNDYPLLHSNMLGELQNYRWQNDLYKRDAPSYNLDDPGGSVHYGGNANLYFNEIDN